MDTSSGTATGPAGRPPPRENLDDRNAVTTVVSKVGEATDEATALRIALLEEQVEMAKAFDAGR
jgi:hypothetical protein